MIPGAVVVNHNAGASLVDCVESLRRAGIDHVVVVDNASSDGSLEALAAADSAVVLIPTGANLGYGSAVNRGMAALDDAVVLVCNPDLLVEPDAPRRLAEAVCADPSLAVAGPLVANPDGTRYPSARAFPSPAVAALHAMLGLCWPGNPWSRRYRMEDRADAERYIDWVSGACFVVRRAAFASIGGFDEGYFMYVEDLDLCWRLGRAGWKVRYLPAARVTHLQGTSTRRHPYQMAFAHHRSAWRFSRRSTRGASRLLLPLMALVLAGRFVVVVAQLVVAQLVVAGGAPSPWRSPPLPGA